MESMLRDLRAAASGLRAEAVEAQLELLARRRQDEVGEEWEAVARSGDPAEWLAGRDRG
jgi:tryptophan 2,3-dioxygenase